MGNRSLDSWEWEQKEQLVLADYNLAIEWRFVGICDLRAAIRNFGLWAFVDRPLPRKCLAHVGTSFRLPLFSIFALDVISFNPYHGKIISV